MGLFIKILLLLVVLALALPFVLKDEQGEPLMTVSDLKQPDMGLGGLVERMPELTNPMTDKPLMAEPETKPAKKTKIYSWEDAQGNTHFSNEPPPENQQARLIEINPNINVMPSTKIPEAKQKTASKSVAGREPLSGPDGPASIYTPEQVDKLIEDARALEGTSQERYEDIKRQ